jgi:predicted Fe-Mo cluster-binding NifX family protein
MVSLLHLFKQIFYHLDPPPLLYTFNITHHFAPFSRICFSGTIIAFLLHMNTNTEKLALPLFGERIAPRLDTAQRLRFVTIRDGVVEESEDITIVGIHPLKLAHWLKEEGIRTLICCGIDRMTSRTFHESGIQLIPRIGADADLAVRAYIDGTIETLSITPAGGPGRGRRHHGGRCGRCERDDNLKD